MVVSVINSILPLACRTCRVLDDMERCSGGESLLRLDEQVVGCRRDGIVVVVMVGCGIIFLVGDLVGDLV